MLAATLLAACGGNASTGLSADGAAQDGDRADVGGDGADTTSTDAPDGDGVATCTPGCGTGSACVDGACLPAAVVLARAPGCGAARLALAAGRVFWTESATGNVESVANAGGGAPTPVASSQSKPGPITADDGNVYWANDGDLSIGQIALPGDVADAGAADAAANGAASSFLTAAAAVRGLLVSGSFLYYTSGPSTYRVARAGGAPTTLATFATCKLSQPVALALDADYVYQTDMLSQFITRARNDGTQRVNDPCAAADAGAPQIAAPETITHSQGELYFDAITRAGDEVVWADHTSVYAKVPGATSNRVVATSAGSDAVTGFVVTGGAVYFAEGAALGGSPTSGTIQVAPLGAPDGGGDSPLGKVVALVQPGAGSFAADATHVYWTTHAPSTTAGAPDDCTIVSLAK